MKWYSQSRLTRGGFVLFIGMNHTCDNKLLMSTTTCSFLSSVLQQQCCFSSSTRKNEPALDSKGNRLMSLVVSHWRSNDNNLQRTIDPSPLPKRTNNKLPKFSWEEVAHEEKKEGKDDPEEIIDSLVVEL